MSKSTTFADDFLNLILAGIGIPGLADNAATSPVVTLYAALHTADPGAGGDQTAHEANYNGYSRTPIARGSASWNMTANQAQPMSSITFPYCNGGQNTVTFWSIGTTVSGAGLLLWSGPLNNSINVSTGVTPYLTPATAIIEV